MATNGHPLSVAGGSLDEDPSHQGTGRAVGGPSESSSGESTPKTSTWFLPEAAPSGSSSSESTSGESEPTGLTEPIATPVSPVSPVGPAPQEPEPTAAPTGSSWLGRCTRCGGVCVRYGPDGSALTNASILFGATAS